MTSMLLCGVTFPLIRPVTSPQTPCGESRAWIPANSLCTPRMMEISDRTGLQQKKWPWIALFCASFDLAGSSLYH
jgi:hypothetical protein